MKAVVDKILSLSDEDNITELEKYLSTIKDDQVIVVAGGP